MTDAPPPVVENNPEAIMDVEQPPAAGTVPVDVGQMKDVPLGPGSASAVAGATAPPVATAGGAAGEAAREILGRLATHEWKEQMALMSVMSLIELIASAIIVGQYLNNAMNAWAIAAGAVSFTISTIIFFLEAFGSTTNDGARFSIAFFLFLWWFAAAVSLTFFGPYQSTCATVVLTNTGGIPNIVPGIPPVANGFFATWFAFIVSCRIFADHSYRFAGLVRQATTGVSKAQALMGVLFLSSAVVMGAGISPCTTAAGCNNYPAFAISLGVISMGICLIMMSIYGAGKADESHVRMIAIFLFVWWGVGTCVVTFGAPFSGSTGNGYFASYFSLFLSYAVMRVTDKAVLPLQMPARSQAQAPPPQQQQAPPVTGGTAI